MRREFLATEAQSETGENTNDFDQGPFVFLGGTINGSNWRERLIPQLTIPFFNPVVANWTTDDAQRENQAKNAAKVLAYVITPRQLGYYSIAEMTAAVCAGNGAKVVVVFLADDEGHTFTTHQDKSNTAIQELYANWPDVEFFEDLETLASFLNKYLEVREGEVV